MTDLYDAIVIGGGFFGCRLALFLRQHLKRVVIVEKESDLLQRASYANQARVHNGYHYPRSFLTAVRSRVNFPKFVEEYKECIVDDFSKYYAIARITSKVGATQFKRFLDRVGAPMNVAPKQVKKLFDPKLIEEVFRVHECAFDAMKLKKLLIERLNIGKVEVLLGCEVVSVKRSPSGHVEAVCGKADEATKLQGQYVFNCTYSQLNALHRRSNLAVIPLKHEITEMALVEVPDVLQHLGITVMCGPFFSLMPFPPRKLHTLSHVRYTPHVSWGEVDERVMDADETFEKFPRVTAYPYMVRDAARCLPVLRECIYRDSIWEVKTVLPQSEVDDSRPILYRKDHGIKNYTAIMGGKIDNIYDVLSEVENSFKEREGTIVGQV